MASMADTQPHDSPIIDNFLHERAEKERVERLKLIANLYLITPFLVIPAFALVVPYAIFQYGVSALPAVGLVPQGLGGFYGIHRTYKIRRELSGKSPIRLSENTFDNKKKADLLARVFEVVCNLTAAIALLIILIYTWIHEPAKGGWWGYSYRQFTPWLGAYATMFMIWSMLIHTYLAWLALPTTALRDLFRTRSVFVDTEGRCRSCRTVIVQSSGTSQQPRTVPYSDA